MEDMHQPEEAQTEPVTVVPVETPAPVYVAPQKPRRSFKMPVLIAGIILLAGLCCLCLCVVVCGTSTSSVLEERPKIAKVIDAYMRAMADRDAEKAYALFSSRAQRQMSISEIKEGMEGANYVLFDGYVGAEVQTLYISVTANTNPDVPQGRVARTGGIVKYQDGYSGSFQAILEQEGGVWKLHHINVTVPATKFSPTKEP